MPSTSLNLQSEKVNVKNLQVLFSSMCPLILAYLSFPFCPAAYSAAQLRTSGMGSPHAL